MWRCHRSTGRRPTRAGEAERSERRRKHGFSCSPQQSDDRSGSYAGPCCTDARVQGRAGPLAHLLKDWRAGVPIPTMLTIHVDADACPVKDEVYRVAGRYDLAVILVSNMPLRPPAGVAVRIVRVDEGPDAADDWIAEAIEANDIVITGDIPLASRALQKGAHALGFHGRPFTPENIGDALATRDLLAGLREQGERGSGPAPFSRRDRSRFLQALDAMIQRIRRES